MATRIEPMEIGAKPLLLLLNWMSPAFPTGSFAYSHGLEWAIDEGTVSKAPDLRQWIEDLLTHGSAWNDAVIFAQCWAENAEHLNELSLALASSAERHLETTQLGRAFAQAASIFGAPLPDFDDVSYPVAAGLACRAMEFGKREAVLAYLQGFSAALVSVAVRLVPLGQKEGLAVLRDLMPVIAAIAARAATATLNDLGSVTLGADIAAMKHETQASRVFRT